MGDVIYEMNNASVNSGGDILKLIEEDYLRADDRVSIKFYRDGKMSTTKLRLTKSG